MTINVTLNNVADLTQTTTAQTTINNNSAAITTGFVSAFNTTGDQLQGTMDANSHQIINLPSPATGNSPVRLQDISTLTGGGTVTNIPLGGTTGQSLVKTSNANFATGWGNPTITGQALTETNDTNVTLTLGGSASTALVNPASITAGWTGTLAVGRGGTGVSTVAGIQALAGSALFISMITGVNFNSANSDTAIPITLPTGYTRFVISNIYISGASASLTTSTAGVFTNTAQGGVALVTLGAITINTAADATNNNIQVLAVNNATTESYLLSGLPVTPNIYFHVGTAQGSAATASVSVHYRPLP